MTNVPENLKPTLAELILAVADDKLILGHRNSDWTGLAPILEEDIAFSSIAQDEIAHAQALYEIASELVGRTADELAFGRAPDQFRCATIAEFPDNFNWGIAIVRQFFCDHFDWLRLQRMAKSAYQPLAALAKRLAAEEKVHVDHVSIWMKHLGRGTDEARRRLQRALETLEPSAPMLFEPVPGQDVLEAHGFYPEGVEDMFEQWRRMLLAVTEPVG
ncbi:MAG TPA: 1,2-phenylacetyl-CoA epoxidase subunit PaaC, partial [Myxococcota bacterium]